eukprot:c15923_g1_i1 orf=494-1252(-)
MASTAATSNRSAAPSAKVDELRGVLASKGLVVKDSILARLAKSKSFKGLSSSETLTLTQDAEPEVQSLAQDAELGIDRTAHTQDEESGFVQKLEASNTQKPTQEASDKSTELSNSSGTSKKDEKHDDLPSPVATSNGGKALAFTDAAVYSTSEQERKQRRSERFGTVSDDEKLKMRAARFGIENDVMEEAEKKRARAARFGIVDEDAKKKARLERFNKDSEQEDKEENERRKARALRFATPIEKSLLEANKN